MNNEKKRRYYDLTNEEKRRLGLMNEEGHEIRQAPMAGDFKENLKKRPNASIKLLKKDEQINDDDGKEVPEIKKKINNQIRALLYISPIKNSFRRNC